MFITIEGIDGSGTTTITSRLASNLDDATQTEEPSTLWTGRITRDSFEKREVDDLTRFYLFMADRVEHCTQIVEPNLERGHTVISDRGPDSTRAYHADDLTESFIEYNLEKTLSPDLTIWLDVDRVDGSDFQEKVAAQYEHLNTIEPRIHKVNANKPLDYVERRAMEIIHDTE
jgi:dTMP kinase